MRTLLAVLLLLNVAASEALGQEEPFRPDVPVPYCASAQTVEELLMTYAPRGQEIMNEAFRNKPGCSVGRIAFLRPFVEKCHIGFYAISERRVVTYHVYEVNRRHLPTSILTFIKMDPNATSPQCRRSI